MNSISSPRFGMYHAIGAVKGGWEGSDRITGALAMEELLNSKFPYFSPDKVKRYDPSEKDRAEDEVRYVASPKQIQEMKKTAGKYHSIAQSVQAELKAIDPDYRADPFAVAIHGTFLPGDPVGIATGEDARFLSVLEKRSRPLYDWAHEVDNYGGEFSKSDRQSLDALSRVRNEHIQDLTSKDKQHYNPFRDKQGQTLDVTLSANPHGLDYVENIRIR